MGLSLLLFHQGGFAVCRVEKLAHMTLGVRRIFA